MFYLVRRSCYCCFLLTTEADGEVVEPASTGGIVGQVSGHVVLLVVRHQEHQGQGKGSKPYVPAVVMPLAGPNTPIDQLYTKGNDVFSKSKEE